MLRPESPSKPLWRVKSSVICASVSPRAFREELVQRRIDVPGAGAHHEALERRQPHAGVDALAAAHGGRAAAVAEVRGHELELRERASQAPGGLLGHVAVARSMKAVTPQFVLLVELVRYRVQEGAAWQGLVKRRIEHRHLQHARKRAPRRRDAQQVGGIVQRRQRGAVADRLHGRVVDHHALGEGLAAVYYPVTDGGDPGVIAKLCEHLLERFRVAAAAQTFSQPVADDRACFRLDQRELQRRAAAVDDEDSRHLPRKPK